MKRNANHIYDYAIIGAGLNGLAIAAGLSKETDNIILLEASEAIGGVNRPVKNAQASGELMNNGIRMIPNTPSAENAIRFIEKLIETSVGARAQDSAPVTYESGSLRPFLGFGDNPPAFYEELAYYTSAQRLELTLPVFTWAQMLFEKFRGDFSPRSYVTKFQIEDENVKSVWVNGAKTVQAKNFIFCGNPRDLEVLLPQEALATRARQKIAKSDAWTAVCLDLTHNHIVTTEANVHVLDGTTHDDVGPCAGIFNGQISQWITFADREATEESEAVAHSLKKIKRQIKRAYPEALEGLLQERISVIPNCAGPVELPLSANQSLTTAENLWIASGRVHAQRNLVGCLQQAELVLSALGFSETVVESNIQE